MLVQQNPGMLSDPHTLAFTARVESGNRTIMYCLFFSQVRVTANARCLQYKNQELRSRQRTNYQVLVSSLPLYQQCTEAVVLFLVLTAMLLPTTPLNNHIKYAAGAQYIVL